ncbi:MAG: DNA-binding response regulator [Sphingobacteriales bacterium 50-39]|nr:response regulator transcription factor [Sphingobacteriales bacterium]OJW53136.1 MAG: DNA-binding response regulator [Sphingobacteriales bacterium 50-39]
MTSSKKIKCLVIDDEPPARDVLKKYIASIEMLELVGEFSNAVETLSYLQTNSVNLLFLDIKMPLLLGTSFLRTLKNQPKVIFTTAYRKYAVDGFDLNAVDFLLKPISFERFLRSVNKVMRMDISMSEYAASLNEIPPTQSNPFLYFKADRKMVKVFFEDILYIESLKDYIKIVTKNNIVISKQALSSLEEMLPKNDFIRVHRSFIIAINKIDSYNADIVGIGKIEVPVGRLYKHDVNKALKAH